MRLKTIIKHLYKDLENSIRMPHKLLIVPEFVFKGELVRLLKRSFQANLFYSP